MKKLLLTSFVFIITITSLSGQAELGIKSGFLKDIRFSNFSNGSVNHKDANSGFYVSIFSDIKISDRYIIEPEFTYLNISDNLDKLQLGVLLKYKFAKKFYVFAGPHVGYLLNPNDNLKKIVIGASVGLSYEIIDKLSIEARYVFNAYSLNESADPSNFKESQGFQIGLVYRF